MSTYPDTSNKVVLTISRVADDTARGNVRNYLRAGGVRVRATQLNITTINDFPQEVFLFC